MATFVIHPRNSTLVHQSNYVKVMRMIPFIRSMHCGAKVFARTETHQVEISIQEVTPYTTTFAFVINYIDSQKWFPQIQIMVRCYHDARVAEVIKFQQHKHFSARYSYPNPHMHQRNEKQQINRFLGEWMNYCLQNRCTFQTGEVSLDA